MDNIVVLILGSLATIVLVLASLSTHRPRLLILASIVSSLLAVQLLLTASWVGLAAVLIGLVRNLSVLASLKYSWLNHPVFIPVFVIAHGVAFSFVNDWSTIEWWAFAPVIGSMLATVAVFFSNMIYTKIFYLSAGALWFIYEFQIGAFTQLIGEGFAFISNIVALTVLVRAANKGIEPIEPVTEAISVLTQPIPTEWKETATQLFTAPIQIIQQDNIPVSKKERIEKSGMLPTKTIPIIDS